MSFGANLFTSVTTQLPALANTRFLVVADNCNQKFFKNSLIGLDCSLSGEDIHAERT